MRPTFRPPRRVAGQATTEFIVCLFAMIPMFFGIYYFARYSDVKQSAIQASRYVAFERTWDPYNRAKTPTQLADETRARFFTPVSRNAGKIAFRDGTASLNADKGRVPLWSDATYKPLLKNYSDVAIRETQSPLNTGIDVGALENTIGAPVFHLPKSDIVRAEVTVSLANVAHYDVLRNINLGMPGATAIGGSAWNASGTKGGDESVCARVVPTVLGHYIKPVADVLGVIMSPLFERNAPDIGLVLPDYVPPGSVRSGATPQPYTRQNGNRC